jgi:NAD-dependent dihydropyrimidine dehydrogenase PreA subunit
MATAIYTYTGTGNALWAARRIAEGLGEAEVRAIPGPVSEERDVIGLIFPVYMWGPPTPVVDFIHQLPQDTFGYIFAVAVNAGEPGRTLLMVERALKSRKLTLSAGWGLRTPSNYIPWGGPGMPDELDILFSNAEKKIRGIVEAVNRRITPGPERDGWKGNAKSFLFHNISMSQVPKMDRSFRVSSHCTGCRICSEVCPAGNISFSDGRPEWNHRCHQCFACLQWCPVNAIEYGKSARYERYHHPDVSLADIKELRKQNRISLD